MKFIYIYLYKPLFHPPPKYHFYQVTTNQGVCILSNPSLVLLTLNNNPCIISWVKYDGNVADNWATLQKLLHETTSSLVVTFNHYHFIVLFVYKLALKPLEIVAIYK